MKGSLCHPRSRPFDSRRHHGFGLIESLVVVVILTVLTAIIVPVVAKVRRSSRSVQCMSNLHQIGAALHAYALSNQGRLPDPAFSDKSWEQVVLPYYSARFECPADSELYPAIGSSYDWRDTGKSTTTMAGKPLADTNRSDAVLALESLPGWHAKGFMNVVLIDGSTRTMQESACFDDLQTPVREGPAFDIARKRR